MAIIVPASQVTTVTTGGTVTDTRDVSSIASIVVDLGRDYFDANFLDGTLDDSGVFLKSTVHTAATMMHLDLAQGTYELSGAVAVPAIPIPADLVTALVTDLVKLGELIEAAAAVMLTDTQGVGTYTTVPIVPTVATAPPPPPI